ncbi:MAG TPA: MATE family efflux transporter [Gemmatimonadaceae bacterium]|nr:MATE family efflux transporter [Gemmatimonadaceae bacterium]
MITTETITGAAVPRGAYGELRAMARLALPVVLVQVGMLTMGAVDTAIVGRLSAQALASVALGNLYFFNASIFSMGALMALDPLVAQAVGARDMAGAARAVQRGLVLAVLLSALTSLLLLGIGPLLALTRQQPEVVPGATRYVHISIVGVLPYLGFVVLRQSLQALGHLRPIVVTIVIANLANLVLDWALVFGHWGFPAMGVDGSAWATAACRWLMLLLLPVLDWRTLRRTLVPIAHDLLARRPLARMLRLGAPIGGHQLLEAAAFGTVGLLMGMLGTNEVAGHQVAINLAALTFMVPLGVGAAAAVRVGYAVGAGEPRRARQAARAALVVGVGFMCCTALLFLALPTALARIFTADVGVLAVAAALIPIAGIFQVFDGIQAVAAGILRGAGDTHVPMLIALVGFWLVGVPVSALLAFRTGAGAAGLWWGFVAGLGVVALILLWRVRTRLRRTLTRIEH